MEIIIVLLIVALVGVFANKYMNQRSQMRQQKQPPQQDEETSEARGQAQLVEAVHNASNDQTKEKSVINQNNMENKMMEERKGTRDLFLETLTKIGCQYEIEEEEEGDIHFGYQGEFFMVRASNNGRFIHIYDTHWGHVDLNDIDECMRLRKAINESNIRNGVTAIYTVDEERGYLNIHCKSVILFIPEIPDIGDYLRIELNDYFRVHETINVEMAKLRDAEVEKQ